MCMKSLASLIAVVWTFGQTVNAQLLPPPAVGEYQLKGEFSYFSTNSNFDDGGSNTSLENGSSLSTMMTSGEFIVDITPHIRLQAGLLGGQTTVRRYSQIEDESTTHTNFGVSEMWARGQYWLNFWNMDIVPDVALYYPLFRVDTNSGDPLIGEGALRMRTGSWLIYEWGNFYPFGFLGAEYRDEGRSTLLPYNIGVQWVPNDTWWTQLEIRGFTSITGDSDDEEIRDSYQLNVQGGSARYFSMDPSSNEAVAMAGMHFGQFGAYIGVANTLTGRNSANGFTGFVGLTYDGSAFSSGYSPYVDTPPAEEKFNIKSDSYDESLFRDSPKPKKVLVKPTTPPPTVIQSPTQSSRRNRVRPRPLPPPSKSSSETLPTVELILKDTQKSLEKRKPEE